jgi:hypothetical protein
MSIGDRQNMSRSIVHVITVELEFSLDSGTFDSRLDRFLTRVPVLLDRQGWTELMEIHQEAFDATLAVQKETTKRLRDGGQAIEGTSVQTFFELPRSEFDVAAVHPTQERPERRD